MTAPENQNNAADANAEAKSPLLSPDLIETQIIKALDPTVTQPDAPKSAQEAKQGHPPRRGILIFCPHRLVDTVWQITPKELKQQNIEGIILDLDNTIVKWRQEKMTGEVENWLKSLQEENLRLCILSNSPIGNRSERIATRLNCAFVRHARKPARSGFRRAMSAMSTTIETTAIVGDQMFTDILGGNRVGIYTIMVKPINKSEFPYTRFVSRPPEKLLLKYFKKNGGI